MRIEGVWPLKRSIDVIAAEKLQLGSNLLKSARSWLPFVFAIVVAALVTWGINLDWIPNDDGTIAHVAERVRAGEVPHVDFDAPYTGGLGYLNALVLSIDTSLVALRYPLLLLALVAGVVMFRLLRQGLSPVLATVVVGCGLLVSMFLHASPEPTWYNVYLGVLSLGALWSYFETERRSWLWVAGSFVGISALVKVTAVYFALAISIALAIRASQSRRQVDRSVARLVLCSTPILVMALVSAEPTVNRVVILVTPLGVVCLSAIIRSFIGGGRLAPTRTLAGDLGVLAASTVLPILAFVAYYGSMGGLEDLYRGVVLTPRYLLSEFSYDLPGISTLLFMLIVGGLVLVVRVPSIRPWSIGLGWMMACCALYVADPETLLLSQFFVLLWVPPMCAFVVAVGLFRGVYDHLSLILGVGATCFALVQFPHAGQHYVVYTAMLGIPALVWIIRQQSPRASIAAISVVLVTTAVLVVGKVEGRVLVGDGRSDGSSRIALNSDRSGLRVSETFLYYNNVIKFVEDNRRRGETFIAGPSSPELYFLVKEANPTPLTLEHLSVLREGARSTADYIRLLKPGMVVVNLEPPNHADPGVAIKTLSGCGIVDDFGPFRVADRCNSE